MTSNVNAKLTEFANNPACDQAEVMKFLGREVTALTQNDLPTLRKISAVFAGASPTVQTELNHYINRIERGQSL